MPIVMDHADIWIVLDRPFFLRYDKNIQGRYTNVRYAKYRALYSFALKKKNPCRTFIRMAIAKISRLSNALVIISTLLKEDYHAGIHKNTPFYHPDIFDSIVPLYLAFSGTNTINGY